MQPTLWTAVVVGAVIGWFLKGALSRGKSRPQPVDAVHRDDSEGWDAYLELLRRELANLILKADPDRMEAAYLKAADYEYEMRKATPERVSVELKALTLKYPSYFDFDILGTLHFIPYGSARDMADDDDLIERYLDISKFMVLTRIGKKAWNPVPIFVEEKQKVLYETIQSERDRRLKERMAVAMGKYRVYEQALRDGETAAEFNQSYEDADCHVFRAPSGYTPEIEYLFHFKKTGECAKYSFFVHDDGHTTDSFYRTNSSFQEPKYLSIR